jgi:hypothetical protein
VAEYLSVLDDAAFGAATPTEAKSISPTDPVARYTAAADTPAVYAYSDNYLVDLKHVAIMDVEAMTAVRQAEVRAARTMLDRTAERLDVTPSRPSPIRSASSGWGKLRLRGPSGANDEFLLAASAQNLRKLAKLHHLSSADLRLMRRNRRAWPR